MARWNTRHVKKMLEKSLGHDVIALGENDFMVKSGNSGNYYMVEMTDNGAEGLCSCPWGTKGDTIALEDRSPVTCSHVIKVINGSVAGDYKLTVRTGNSASVKHLHRKTETVEGVTVTSRLQ